MRPGSGALPRGEVAAAFDVGAPAYDGLVGANPGYHAHLRISARRLRLPQRGRGLRLLDVGCGTGASTAALLAAAPDAEIIGVDASAGMLQHARAKPWPATVRFVHAPVENLDDAGIRGPFDAVLAAYLVRNVADPDAALQRLRELLRPGATLAVHEYSVRDSLRAAAVWNAVCGGIIIPLARFRTGDTTLYRHLRTSVNAFDGATAFRNRLRNNGFTGVHSETFDGWQHHVVHTFLGDAPR